MKGMAENNYVVNWLKPSFMTFQKWSLWVLAKLARGCLLFWL